jgi:HEAT repeat protein
MRAISVLALALATVTPAAAQQPHVANGTLAPQAAPSPFVSGVQALVAAETDVGWFGYAVPAREGGHMMCDGYGGSGTVYLEGRPAGTKAPARTTPAAPFLVLFRVEAKRIDRIRMVSDGCEIDAGGRTVRWLQGVSPADSVALLESVLAAAEGRRDRTSNGALSAMAMHAAPEAGTALERAARGHASPGVRGEALFWMAQRGAPGADRIILEAIDKDTSADVRKRGVFALSQLDDAVAVEALLRVARNNTTPATRGEAIFWLGQKAGRKAAAQITERIEQDPDTDVKKRAVFALGQLPKDEGVPLLIQVAKTNANPAVRKQAIFWLGQSKDPRAIEFFAEVLK